MKEIKIKLCEKDMDIIEDRFFCEINEMEYKKMKPRLLRIWRRLCEAMGDK